MGKFDCQITNENGTVKVKMSGVIDEDVDFSSYQVSGGQECIIDSEGVKSINSCGIREWIKWVSTIQVGKIVYQNCPKIIVDQINMVQGFLPPTASVLSFYVPYYSEESEEEKNVLFRLGTEFSSQGEINEPSVSDSGGKPMEMDVVEAKYFKFLKR